MARDAVCSVSQGHEECVHRENLLTELGEGDAVEGVECEDAAEEVLSLVRHGEEVAEEIPVQQEIRKAIIRGQRLLPRATVRDHVK